jgi:hypothetical protein
VNQLSPQLLHRTGRRFSGASPSLISTAISHFGQINCTPASLYYLNLFNTDYPNDFGFAEQSPNSLPKTPSHDVLFNY